MVSCVYCLLSPSWQGDKGPELYLEILLMEIISGLSKEITIKICLDENSNYWSW